MTINRMIGIVNFFSMCVMLASGSYGIAFFNLSIVFLCTIHEFLDNGK